MMIFLLPQQTPVLKSLIHPRNPIEENLIPDLATMTYLNEANMMDVLIRRWQLAVRKEEVAIENEMKTGDIEVSPALTS